MSSLTMSGILKDNPVCAIMRNVPVEKTVDYAAAVYGGGIRLFEVAMNSPAGAMQIRMLREHFAGKKVYIGAGTVTDLDRCKAAQAAGAQFFLTPSVSVDTLEFCRKEAIPLLPGVMTPTDVAVCISYGYPVMKLFPAGDLPMGYIKSLKGPFDGTDYVAVGGVNTGNIKTFLAAGFIGVGIGSNLIPKEYVEQDRWKETRILIQRMMESVV